MDERTLIVDDDAASRELLSLRVRKLGAEATVVPTGEEAIEAVALDHFDLVFMDHAMPGMSGLETSHALRALRPNLRIVVVSAGFTDADRAGYRTLGVRDFVDKPVDPGRLADSMKFQAGVVDSPVTEAEEVIARLMAICDGNASDVAQLVGVWTDSSERLLDKLDRAVREERRDLIARYAHTLKGSSGSFRLDGVWFLAQQLEAAARAEGRAGILTRYEALEDRSRASVTALRRGVRVRGDWRPS